MSNRRVRARDVESTSEVLLVSLTFWVAALRVHYDQTDPRDIQRRGECKSVAVRSANRHTCAGLHTPSKARTFGCGHVRCQQAYV